jgi:hypothetical protein
VQSGERTELIEDDVSSLYNGQCNLLLHDKKLKQQKEAAGAHTQGSDFAGPFTRMSCTRAYRHATPRPGGAGRGE